MRKNKMNLKSSVFCLFITLLIIAPSIISIQPIRAENETFFSITLLTPPGWGAINSFIMPIKMAIVDIGINVTIKTLMWSDIFNRLWYYPIGKEYGYIPTYDEGGFDTFIIGLRWRLDWDPVGIFDTASIVPNGDNFYQYSNATFDQVLRDYTTDFNADTRIAKAKKLQHILYEDLPSIALAYHRKFLATKEGLIGVDKILLELSIDRCEYWDDPDDHNMTYLVAIPFNDYNIFTAGTHSDMQWMQAIYSGLFARVQGSHLFEPLIANNYTISTNGKDITVDINPNAKFSNGNPVTAEDVKYSYQLYMTPIFKYFNSNYDTITSFFENNNSIEVVDTDTLIFHFKEKTAFAFEALSYGIIEKALVEPAISAYGYGIFNQVPFTGDVNDTLVTSCGPFFLKDYNHITNKVILTQNPYFAGEQPKLQQITFIYVNEKDDALSELIAGKADIISTEFFVKTSDLEHISGVTGTMIKIPEHSELAINMMHPYIGTGELTPKGTPEAAKLIRKAISHAIPRQAVIDNDSYYYAVPASTPMPDACIGYDETLQPYTYDVNLAQQLMEQAGFIKEHPSTSANTGTDTNTASAGIDVLIVTFFVGLTMLTLFNRKNKKY